MDGRISVEVFPDKSYKFRMTYNYTSHTDWFAISEPSTTVVFQTELAQVVLYDHMGDPLDGGEIRYAAGSWQDFGTTGDDGPGTATKELFSGSRKFRVTYNYTQETKTQSISYPVVFQTGAVHSDSGTCTKYAAGSWRPFTQDIELLPGSRKFRFNDGTPDTYYTIEVGIVNLIH